ncbi:hypothetical protein L3Q82_015520 [Scortum barcoo]|uniref:Uncharacterized protein n=1 Tax=Scortum barcoo TaxID=214431 RepID=A0ACB8VQB3_9TELE|nr:hypothetical protein L3Q82_015520 [Scortum barcoo]
MVDTLRDLSNSMARMQTQLSLLTPGSAGSEGTPPGLSSSLAAGSTVSTPHQPSSYSSDNAKIGYVGQEAVKRLLDLRQGSQSVAVAAYSVDFQHLGCSISYLLSFLSPGAWSPLVEGSQPQHRLVYLYYNQLEPLLSRVTASIQPALHLHPWNLPSQKFQISLLFPQSTTTWLPSSAKQRPPPFPLTGPTTAPLTCSLVLLSLPADFTISLGLKERPWKNILVNLWPAGLIRPSSSPLGAGFFFLLRRRNKTLRPCIDFRGLNDITIKNKYPLPLIDPAFEPFHQATIFSKLDLRNAYHLVRIREGDEWKRKTAFQHPPWTL